MDDLKIFGYRCCFVEPIRQEGMSDSGMLYVADPYERVSPFVLARILDTHPSCCIVKTGEVVITLPHAFEKMLHNGKTYHLMKETNALAVVEGYDDEETEATA